MLDAVNHLRRSVCAWRQASTRSLVTSFWRSLASASPSSSAEEGLRFRPRVEAAGTSELSRAGTVILCKLSVLLMFTRSSCCQSSQPTWHTARFVFASLVRNLERSSSRVRLKRSNKKSSSLTAIPAVFSFTLAKGSSLCSSVEASASFSFPAVSSAPSASLAPKTLPNSD